MASSIAACWFQFSTKLPASYPGLLIAASVVPFFVPFLLLSIPFLLLFLLPVGLALIFLLGLYKLLPWPQLPLIGTGKQDSSEVNRLQHVEDRAPGAEERSSSSSSSSSSPSPETRGGGTEEDKEEAPSRKKKSSDDLIGASFQVEDIKAEQPAGDQSIVEENYNDKFTLPPAGEVVLHPELPARGESIREENLHASGMEDWKEESTGGLPSIEAEKWDKIPSSNVEEKLQLPVLPMVVKSLEEERETLHVQGTQFEPVINDPHSSAGLGITTAVNPVCLDLASNAESIESLDMLTGTLTGSGQIVTEAGQVEKVPGTSAQTSIAALSSHPPKELETLAGSEPANYSIDAGALPGQSITLLQIGSHKIEALGLLAGKASWIEASNQEQEHGALAETETNKKYLRSGSGESLDKHTRKAQDIQTIEHPEGQTSTGELEEGRTASTDAEKSHFDFIGKQVDLEQLAGGDKLSAVISTCKDNVESLVATCVADECINKQGYAEFPHRDLSSVMETETVIKVISMDEPQMEDSSKERYKETFLVVEDLDVFKTTSKDNEESCVNTCVVDEYIDKQGHAEFHHEDLSSSSETERVTKVVSVEAPQMEDPLKERDRETSLVAEDTHDHGHLDVCKTMESIQEVSFCPIERTDFSHITGEAGSKEHDDIQSLSVKAVEEVLEAQEKPETWQIDRRSQNVEEQEQSSTDHEKSTEFPHRDLSSVTETETVTKVVSRDEPQMEDPSKERDRETSVIAEDIHEHGHSDVCKTSLKDNVESLVDTCVADEYIDNQGHSEFPLRDLSPIAETETVTEVVTMDEPQMEKPSKETHRETSLVAEGTHDQGQSDVCKTMESIQDLSSLRIEVVSFSHISSEAGEKKRDDIQSLSVGAVEEVLEAQEKPEIWHIDRRSQSVKEQEQSSVDHEKSTEFPPRDLSSVTETDTVTKVVSVDEPQLEDPSKERGRETLLVAGETLDHGHLDVQKTILKDHVESLVDPCVADEYINKQGHAAEFPHKDLPSSSETETVTKVVSMDAPQVEDPSKGRERETFLIAEDIHDQCHLDVHKTTLKDHVESLVDTCVVDEYINKQGHAEFPHRDLSSSSETEAVTKVVSMDVPQMEDPSKERDRERSLVAEGAHDYGHLDVCKTMESIRDPTFHPIEVTNFSHIGGEAGDKECADTQSLSVRAVIDLLEAQEKPEIWQIDRRSQSIHEEDQSHNQEQQSAVMSLRNTESGTFLHGIHEAQAIPAHEANLKEKSTKSKAKGVNELGLLEDIRQIMKIVGYSGDPHASIMEQIRALYMFLGVEPLSNHTKMDESEMANEVELLKTVVGVK